MSQRRSYYSISPASASTPSSTSVSTTSTGGLMCAADLGRRAARQIAAHVRRIGIDAAGASARSRRRSPGPLRSRSRPRCCPETAGSCPAATLRPAVFSASASQHEAHPGQDHAAVKDAIRVERVDRHRRAGVDDDAGRREEIGRGRAPPRGDERCPAVRAELRRPRVAVGDAARGVGRRQPFRRQAPARELRLDANARRFARDVDAQHARRPRQVLPGAQRKRADLAVGRHAEPQPVARAAKAPFHPAVAGVDDEDPAHDESRSARTRLGPHARRSVISPDRKRARRGPSASTSAPLASTPATLPVTVAPSGSSSRTGLPW